MSDYTKKQHYGNFRIPVGLRAPKDMSITVSDLDSVSLQKASNYANLSCFICNRHVESENNSIDLGIPFKVCATQITDEEREAQSSFQKRLNLANEDDCLSHPVVEITEYDPYKCVAKPTRSVTQLVVNNDNRFYMKIESPPPGVYTCCDCRRAGESGTEFENNEQHTALPGVRVRSPKDRNIVNKYMQRECGTWSFHDGKRRYWFTDRFNLILNTREANMSLLNEQFAISLGWDNKEEELSKKQKAEGIRRLICPILREFINDMFKSVKPSETNKDNKEYENIEVRDISDFEKSFDGFLKVWRVALEFVHRNSGVKELLIKDVFIWNANPFAKTSRDRFLHLLDVLFILPLVGINFNFIKRQWVMAMFQQMINNFNRNDEQIDKKIKVDYLRQLFTEGRNQKLAKSMLYINCFFSFTSGKSTLNIVNELDKYGCGLPLRTCIGVWRQMQLCNDSVKGLIPVMVNGELKPGLMMYLGMTDPKAELRQHSENIFEWIMWVRANGKKWSESTIPSAMMVNFERLAETNNLGKNADLRVAHANILNNEMDRRAFLMSIHLEEIPPPHPERGAPRFTDLQCGYPSCAKKFSSINDLKTHLGESRNQSYYDDDSQFSDEVLYHRIILGIELKFNEDTMVAWTGDRVLTPEKVRSEGLTVCPAEHCHLKQQEFSTPEELVDHIASYGLEPFWYKGWKKSGEVNVEVEEEKNELKSDYTNPSECVVCCDLLVSTVLFPCYHAAMCGDCAKKLKTCPCCRREITEIVPLAMGGMKIYMS
jgi:hypothetical protein